MALVLILTICLYGCQATPENKVVQGKNQEYLKNLNTNNINNDFSLVPKTFESSIKIAKGNININAAVTLPLVNKFPIIKVKPHELNNNDIDNFKNAVFPGQTIYISDEAISKEELEQQIIDQKQMIARLESESEGEAPEDIIKMHKKGLADLESQYNNAKSKSEIKENITDGHFGTTTDMGTTGGGHVKKPNWQKYGFLAYKSKSLKLSYITMNDYYKYQLIGFENETKQDAKNASITYEQAKTKADDILQGLELNHYNLDASGQMNIVEPKKLDLGIEGHDKGYFFIYTKNVEGILVSYTKDFNMEQKSETPRNFEIWNPEYLRIEFDPNGNLLLVDWQCPDDYVETLTDDVQLLSFNDIMNKFESQAKAIGGWIDSPDITNKDVNIKEIKLNMCRIAMKDNPDEYIIVPVWDFFGSETHQSSTGLASDQGALDEFRQSYMTINAIDGSIIDRTLGY